MCVVPVSYTHLDVYKRQHLDCADHAWVTREEFDSYPFSKADLEIIRAIRQLPELPRWQSSGT